MCFTVWFKHSVSDLGPTSKDVSNEISGLISAYPEACDFQADGCPACRRVVHDHNPVVRSKLILSPASYAEWEERTIDGKICVTEFVLFGLFDRMAEKEEDLHGAEKEKDLHGADSAVLDEDVSAHSVGAQKPVGEAKQFYTLYHDRQEAVFIDSPRKSYEAVKGETRWLQLPEICIKIVSKLDEEWTAILKQYKDVDKDFRTKLTLDATLLQKRVEDKIVQALKSSPDSKVAESMATLVDGFSRLEFEAYRRWIEEVKASPGQARSIGEKLVPNPNQV